MTDLPTEFPTVTPSSGFSLPSGEDMVAVLAIGSILFLAALVGLAIVQSLVAGFIGRHAQRRGRSFEFFFWMSVLSPAVSAFIVATIAPMTLTAIRVGCTSCSEQVASTAARCPNCQQALSPNSAPGEAAVARFVHVSNSIARYSRWVMFAAIGLFALWLALLLTVEYMGIGMSLLTPSYVLAVVATLGITSSRSRRKSLPELKALVGA